MGTQGPTSTSTGQQAQVLSHDLASHCWHPSHPTCAEPLSPKRVKPESALGKLSHCSHHDGCNTSHGAPGDCDEAQRAGCSGTVVTVMGAQLQALTSLATPGQSRGTCCTSQQNHISRCLCFSHMSHKSSGRRLCPALPYAQASERLQVSPAETTHNT